MTACTCTDSKSTNHAWSCPVMVKIMAEHDARVAEAAKEDRKPGDVTELSDREIDVFTEGEEHALRELADAARKLDLLGELTDLFDVAGYNVPNEKGEFAC